MIMKKYTTIFLLLISFHLMAQKIPSVMKTVFTEAALNQSIQNTKGETIPIQKIFETNRGQVIVLDLWATWCPDCIITLPKLKKLQIDNPKVKFIYFSLDRNEESWKKGLVKHQLIGDHYWFDSGWKNDFNEMIELNWIPRYLILDQEGNIAHYYATSTDDIAVQNCIDSLLEK